MGVHATTLDGVFVWAILLRGRKPVDPALALGLDLRTGFLWRTGSIYCDITQGWGLGRASLGFIMGGYLYAECLSPAPQAMHTSFPN